jgi:solute carrier family 25 (mitochondrial phosphate transporter), member 23/24/25/41
MNGESQEAREKRIKDLWRKLDTSSSGQIDLGGLKKGLKKIDHPLKNADDLLHDVLKAVDTSGDGRIQFQEFLVFVQHAEKELWQLFESIDRDHSGALDKDELRAAFQRAGLTISNAKLDQFFDEVDTNHDGEISFEEWRYGRCYAHHADPSDLNTGTFCYSSHLASPTCGQSCHTIQPRRT